MSTFFLEDAAGDLDLFLALTERGAGDHHQHSQATGEHAVAATERVVGADRLVSLLTAVRRATGGEATVSLRALDHANPGREWALRTSAADFAIYCPEGDVGQLRTVVGQFRPGVDLISYTRSGTDIELSVKYLSAHPTSNARQEIETALRNTGISFDTGGDA